MANTEQVMELISSMEQAALMAKQIGATVEPTQLLQIYSSLHHAHHRLSAFLSAENSISSSEPMQLGEEEEEEEERNSAVEKVEERMRECFIKNKRPKRSLSPSAAEERRFCEDGFGFDPHGTKLRALDLVFQFHA